MHNSQKQVELWENCLQAFEAVLVQCPNEGSLVYPLDYLN